MPKRKREPVFYSRSYSRRKPGVNSSSQAGKTTSSNINPESPLTIGGRGTTIATGVFTSGQKATSKLFSGTKFSREHPAATAAIAGAVGLGLGAGALYLYKKGNWPKIKEAARKIVVNLFKPSETVKTADGTYSVKEVDQKTATPSEQVAMGNEGNFTVQDVEGQAIRGNI